MRTSFLTPERTPRLREGLTCPGRSEAQALPPHVTTVAPASEGGPPKARDEESPFAEGIPHTHRNGLLGLHGAGSQNDRGCRVGGGPVTREVGTKGRNQHPPHPTLGLSSLLPSSKSAMRNSFLLPTRSRSLGTRSVIVAQGQGR